MTPGDVILKVKCSECGSMIRTAVVRRSGNVVCDRCYHPGTPSCSNGGTGHWHSEDDMSGGSGSWDAMVKLYEESQ